jgi:hypothetical protein
MDIRALAYLYESTERLLTHTKECQQIVELHGSDKAPCKECSGTKKASLLHQQISSILSHLPEAVRMLPIGSTKQVHTFVQLDLACYSSVLTAMNASTLDLKKLLAKVCSKVSKQLWFSLIQLEQSIKTLKQGIDKYQHSKPERIIERLSPVKRSAFRCLLKEIHLAGVVGFGWRPGYRLHVRDHTIFKLFDADHLNRAAISGLDEWGIGGSRVQQSSLFVLGPWVQTQRFFFSAWFKGATRESLDKLVLWAQQYPEVDTSASPNQIDEALLIHNTWKASSDSKLFAKLKKSWEDDSESFYRAAFQSLISSAGPDISVVDDVGSTTPKSLIKKLKSMDASGLDRFSGVCNVAWLEELYTAQHALGLVYCRPNVEEVLGLFKALQVRNEVIHFFTLQSKDLTNEAFYLIQMGLMFEAFVESINSYAGEDRLAGRLMEGDGGYECAKHTGLVKIPAGTEKRLENLTLTGTGKEVFYLIYKGATPLLIGDLLVLVRETYDLKKMLEKVKSRLIEFRCQSPEAFEQLDESLSQRKDGRNFAQIKAYTNKELGKLPLSTFVELDLEEEAWDTCILSLNQEVSVGQIKCDPIDVEKLRGRVDSLIADKPS